MTPAAMDLTAAVEVRRAPPDQIPPRLPAALAEVIPHRAVAEPSSDPATAHRERMASEAAPGPLVQSRATAAAQAVPCSACCAGASWTTRPPGPGRSTRPTPPRWIPVEPIRPGPDPATRSRPGHLRALPGNALSPRNNEPPNDYVLRPELIDRCASLTCIAQDSVRYPQPRARECSKCGEPQGRSLWAPP